MQHPRCDVPPNHVLPYQVPPYHGPAGWLALDLDAAPVDWAQVAELVESSYRQVPLTRMLRALDARATP